MPAILNNPTPPRQAARAPTTTDDSTAGVWLGMVWIDTVAKKAYMAVSIAVGAATWSALGASSAVITTSVYPYDTVALGGDVVTSNGVIGGP